MSTPPHPLARPNMSLFVSPKGWCCGGGDAENADGDDQSKGDDDGYGKVGTAKVDTCDFSTRNAPPFVPGGHWMIPTTGLGKICESEFGAVSWNNNHSCDYTTQVRECNDIMDT